MLFITLFEAFVEWIEDAFNRVIEYCLNHPAICIVVCVLLAIIVTLIVILHERKTQKDSGKLRIKNNIFYNTFDSIDEHEEEKRCYQLKINTRKMLIDKCKMEYVEHLNGYQFEGFVSELLNYNGYTGIFRTPYSGDNGADIIAIDPNGLKIAIQCKLWNNNVGIHAVQEVYAAKAFYGCDKAAVITNARFTSSAKQTAAKTDTMLWDRDVLIELMEKCSEETQKELDQLLQEEQNKLEVEASTIKEESITKTDNRVMETKHIRGGILKKLAIILIGLLVIALLMFLLPPIVEFVQNDL